MKVAQTLGVSSRHLERQFKSIVGLSPKSLQRIVGFQRALQLTRNGPFLHNRPWTSFPGLPGAGVAVAMDVNSANSG